MKNFWSTLMLLLVVTGAMAQETEDGYYTGYIVRSAGDTLRGRLLKDNNYLSPEAITFNANGTDQEYTPNNILSFYINELDLLFDSNTISKNKDSNTLVPISGEYTNETETARHFVLVVAKTAEYGIFSFLEKSGVERLYFKQGDKIDELLYYKRYVFPDGTQMLEEKARYRIQLLGLMIGCDGLKPMIDKVGYNTTALRSVLRKYATCRNDEITYQPRKDRIVAKLGLSLGIGTVTSADPSATTGISERNNRFLNSVDEGGGWFEFGLALKVRSRRDSRFTYKAELKLVSRKVKAQWNRPVPVQSVLSRINYEINNTYMRINLLANAHLAQWDNSAVFFEFGGYWGTSVSGSVEMANGVFNGGENYSFTNQTLDDPIIDNEAGFVVGIGGEIDQFGVSLRYYRALGENIDVDTQMALRAAGFALNVVYYF